MKKNFYIIAIATVMGAMMLVACDGGSDAYKSTKKALNEVESAVKNAKTCDELYDAEALSIKLLTDWGELPGIASDEVVKLEQKLNDIEKLAKERESELCK